MKTKLLALAGVFLRAGNLTFGGGSATIMQTQNGVVIRLTSTTRGLKLKLATEGVNEYHTDWFKKVQICCSPGSVEVPFRSPLSVNGNDEIACASAKKSLLGGDAAAGPAVARASTTKAKSAGTASRHRPRRGAFPSNRTSTFM